MFQTVSVGAIRLVVSSKRPHGRRHEMEGPPKISPFVRLALLFLLGIYVGTVDAAWDLENEKIDSGECNNKNKDFYTPEYFTTFNGCFMRKLTKFYILFYFSAHIYTL